MTPSTQLLEHSLMFHRKGLVAHFADVPSVARAGSGKAAEQQRKRAELAAALAVYAARARLAAAAGPGHRSAPMQEDDAPGTQDEGAAYEGPGSARMDRWKVEVQQAGSLTCQPL